MSIHEAHGQGSEPLRLLCPQVEADFPGAKVRLRNREPAPLLWDEHGGTYVLRVAGLEVVVDPELQGAEDEIRLEAALPPSESLTGLIEEFAAGRGLRLSAEAAAGDELLETPILAACHLPAQNLFIFCEAPRLAARRGRPDRLELAVSGAFQSRRLLSREPDIVIHLTGASVSRLLTGLLAWSRDVRHGGEG